MFLNTRSFLFTGVALAGLLAGLGGFLFFANVPDPGASRQEVFASLPPNKQMRPQEINRIIAERQALAPRPSNSARAQVAAAMEAGPMVPSLGKAEERFAAGAVDDSLARERADGRVMAGLAEPAAPAEQPEKDKAGTDSDIVALRDAAVRNDAEAQFALAARLESGSGVPIDKVEALKFYILAAAQGVTEETASESEDATDRKAASAVDRLRAELSPEQVQDAEARAAAFRAR